jgi:hypothetical protein
MPCGFIYKAGPRAFCLKKKGGSKEELGREESKPTDGLSPLIPTGNKRRSWAGRRKNGKGTRRCIGSEQVDVCVGCILALCIDSTVYEDGYIGRRSVRRLRSH